MSGDKRKQYVADFETTTDPEDCRVWGWGICDIDRADTIWDVHIGTNMERFIGRVTEENAVIYFHNLKFDGVFILDWLFRNGYQWVSDTPRRGEFTTLISHMGAWYNLSVAWKNGKKTEFRDSYKKLPMAAARVATAFKLPEGKIKVGQEFYHRPRPIGHMLTMEEREYLAHDVLIIAKAMKVQLDQGMSKLTVGADSLHEYKTLMGSKLFKKMFPVLPESMDAEIRRAYRGGFTYVDTRHQGNITAAGLVFDVNSLYPSVMYDRVLPYDEPVWCAGLPEPTESHPLFLVSVTFTAKLKKDHIPCIQVKGSSRFVNTEYQTHIQEPVTLMCTNVDLALWEDHYDMNILSYNGGWLFKGVQGVFKGYIDKWAEIKANSEGGMRELAKLMLNSLYGKFATNPDVTGKVPVFRNGVVEYETGMPETRDPVYTAMGVFITAYARDVTIRAAQQHYDTFAYADTDSLHLLTSIIPNTLEVHKSKLGAWKMEYPFSQALFMRAKTYTEVVDAEHCHNDDDDHVHAPNGCHVTHIAGLDVKVAKTMTFQHFESGTFLPGKRTPKRVPGGVVLLESGFTMP